MINIQPNYSPLNSCISFLFLCHTLLSVRANFTLIVIPGDLMILGKTLDFQSANSQ
jgi:hypothetical protein